MIEWLSDYFVPFLPQCVLWRVLDCFIVEGYKTLFRVGIAILQNHRDAILASKNNAQLMKAMKPSTIHSDAYPFFLKGIWSVSFSRADLAKPNNINADSLEEVSLPANNMRSTPKMMDESSVIEDHHWIALW